MLSANPFLSPNSCVRLRVRLQQCVFVYVFVFERERRERERQFSNSKTEERNGRRENSEGTEEERKTLPVHWKMPVGLEIITEKPL
jgi:hypothetical protein